MSAGDDRSVVTVDARDRLTHRRRRLRLEVVRLMDARHRRRQRFGQRCVRIRDLPGIDLGEELEDARTALSGLVEVDMEVGDALDPQALAELVPDERHGVAERGYGRIAFGRLADDADPDLGVPQVRRRLDLGDRDEPDPRIRHIPRDDRADLLPQELVDPFCSLAHRRAQLADSSAHGLRREALDDVALDDVVEVRQPMPHS